MLVSACVGAEPAICDDQEVLGALSVSGATGVAPGPTLAFFASALPAGQPSLGERFVLTGPGGREVPIDVVVVQAHDRIDVTPRQVLPEGGYELSGDTDVSGPHYACWLPRGCVDARGDVSFAVGGTPRLTHVAPEAPGRALLAFTEPVELGALRDELDEALDSGVVEEVSLVPGTPTLVRVAHTAEDARWTFAGEVPSVRGPVVALPGEVGLVAFGDEPFRRSLVEVHQGRPLSDPCPF